MLRTLIERGHSHRLPLMAGMQFVNVSHGGSRLNLALYDGKLLVASIFWSVEPLERLSCLDVQISVTFFSPETPLLFCTG